VKIKLLIYLPIVFVSLLVVGKSGLHEYLLSRPYLIYSPGFGGEHKNEGAARFYCQMLCGNEVDFSIVRYSDAAGELSKAVFYTQPSVNTLADELYEHVIVQQKKSIILAGFSCGAGTAINFLGELFNYHNSKKSLKNSRIRSSADAQQIIEALNNGAVVLSAPLLDTRKIRIISDASHFFEVATVGALSVAAYLFGLSYARDKGFSFIETISKVGALGAGLAVHYIVGSDIKKGYSNFFAHNILPYITNKNYDPAYIRPLESVETLRGKLNCPVLLHFHSYDGVLENPDEAVVKLYDAIKNDKTHIVITDDASHKHGSRQYKRALEIFQNNYFPTDEKEFLLTHKQWERWCQQTQPTIQALKSTLIP